MEMPPCFCGALKTSGGIALLAVFACLAAVAAVRGGRSVAGRTPEERTQPSRPAITATRGSFIASWRLDPQDDPKLCRPRSRARRANAQAIGRRTEVDVFREAIIVATRKNRRLPRAAALSLSSDMHYGSLVAGDFHRGNQRGGGEYVSSAGRDRVRALQLMHQSMPLLKDEPDHEAVASFYLDRRASSCKAFNRGRCRCLPICRSCLTMSRAAVLALVSAADNRKRTCRRRRRPDLLPCAAELRRG